MGIRKLIVTLQNSSKCLKTRGRILILFSKSANPVYLDEVAENSREKRKTHTRITRFSRKLWSS